MTRSQAYKLLNLDPAATEADIRKRYKVLAMKVHPDINPDPTANEQFIILSAAVELLLTPEIASYPGELGSKPRKSGKSETPEEQRARMEQARRRYEFQKQQKYAENTRYFTQLTTGARWMVFRWIMRVSCVFALALTLDAVLPSHLENDEITAYAKTDYNGIVFARITALHLRDNGTYFAEIQRGAWSSSYPEVKVQKTWILHTPVSFFTTDDYSIRQTHFDFHLGSIRWLIVLILLMPLLTYFRKRKNITFVFLYMFSFWGVGLLLIYLLLTENRLTHLLTLGFL